MAQDLDGNYQVDLSTVSAVMIAGEWVHVTLGTFTVGRPVFKRETGKGAAWLYGGSYHPLSYFFTDRDGDQITGRYEQIQQMVHATGEGEAPDA